LIASITQRLVQAHAEQHVHYRKVVEFGYGSVDETNGLTASSSFTWLSMPVKQFVSIRWKPMKADQFATNQNFN
jgi:hypothetical protein